MLLSLLVAISATSVARGSAVSSEGTAVPRLVINILVDQLRTDYLEAFMPLYGEEGWKRLLREGLIYEQAQYPLTHPDRACAAATIATGATPSYHGIVGTKWMDRTTLRPVFCVADAAYQGVGGTRENASPKYLGVSTIGDELKVATNGAAIVYALAPSRDAAVLAAGHAADGAVWIDDKQGVLTTSRYYKDKARK